jgi:hypothetical protein
MSGKKKSCPEYQQLEQQYKSARLQWVTYANEENRHLGGTSEPKSAQIREEEKTNMDALG